MKTKENVLRTIETLKEEISSLQSNKEAEEKLSQIKTIVQRWFSETGYFDIGFNPDFNDIKESLCDETIHDIILMLSDTYDTFYNIVKILDMLDEDDD